MNKESDDPEATFKVELSSMPIILQNSDKSCVQVWMEKLNENLLSDIYFKEYWRVWVPKIYSPELNDNCLEWSFNEEEAQKVLFDPLEEFICNGDPQEVIKQLSQLDSPPSICGRVFKNGEPTYSCRECGMDTTCVLCVDCFKQSEHRNHKYKMGTSNGGGCCDCGDTEAWKKEPYCKIHLAGIESKDSTRLKLPKDVSIRAAETFKAVLKYCYDLLSMEHSPNLPPDLRVKDKEDTLSLSKSNDIYCTVLFNDETHTFDQVIHTLTRILKCSQRDAIEYVTNIDREGRAVVKCSGFQYCTELKTEIERFTSRHSNRALKVEVQHAHIIAHQIYAMKLLNWLQQFISHCEGFRIIFSDVALNQKFLLPESSIVRSILFRDHQLWKAARSAWHRLFISGMLTEYESKKCLAIIFTNNYGTVMKDFIRDDHEHSYSIASLAVQLFTVPTLAHHLIAHHDAIFILMNTFISESSRRCNAAGKLEFERNSPNIQFKRAQFILYDLRYLLSSRSETWSDELRKGFIHGISLLLNLLSSMQSMDAVVRQVGQHMEYEQEWESAFNLHVKLSPVISLALEWCGSDKIVLIKSFRMLLRALVEQQSKSTTVECQVGDHSASCINYDVSSEPVSIHLPLSRFLAGLFLYLQKYDLNFSSSEFQNMANPEDIIEPVLRAQAMIAQVNAGMWRRNGYSLIHQLYFYHNVKCRTEMLDKDIILLQTGAILMESNQFIIHILNKFNLINWAQNDFETVLLKSCEEDIRQTISLVEEFLGLIITLVGERYVPGISEVTEDDCLKKEIIQQLCIKPLSHSELNKTLPDDVHYENCMEKVINDVAVFKKPTVMSSGKGVYELKQEYYSDYNVFFYHFTKEELSKSEEAQRKRRKTAGELECCPPPKLPKLTNMFYNITKLLDCDVMLLIMQKILSRALNLKARSFSEPQVHKILHLIGYALQEQESNNYPSFKFTDKAEKYNIYKLLEQLVTSPRIDAHKDLLTWVIDKYRQVAGSSLMEVEQNVSTSQAAETDENEKNEKDDKQWRMQMAAQKRAKVMAQMAAMQKHFMKKNAKLFEETALETNIASEQTSAMEVTQSLEEIPVALGRQQSTRNCYEKTYTCILCQEHQVVKANDSAMVFATFVQQSTVLCQNKERGTTESTPLFLSCNLGSSPHTMTCGHVMHASCWQKYFETVLTKENRRPYRLRQPASFDVEKHEYLCPLCECLSNTVIPVLPALGLLQPTPLNQPNLDFDTWLDIMNTVASCKNKVLEMEINKEKDAEKNYDPDCRYCKLIDDQSSIMSCPIEAVKGHGIEGEKLLSLYSQSGPNLSNSIIEMVDLFTQTAYTKGLGVEHHISDFRVPLLTWKSLSYTIHSIEFILRNTEKPLLGALSSRQRDSLEGLSRVTAMIASVWSNTISEKNGETIFESALTCLSAILKNSESQFCILDWDPFGLLVTLLLSMPTLLSNNNKESLPIITGNISEQHTLRLVFLTLIVKILLTSEFNQDESMDTDEESNNNCKSIATLALALDVKFANQSPEKIWETVKEACLPFLRCCVLYFHYVTDVAAPLTLTELGGDTYENMCRYLGLPETCEELLNSNKILELAIEWSKHSLISSSKDSVPKEPLKINKLVDLPDDYSELINTVSQFKCPNSDKEDSRNPTMCLVCGEMLCSQTYCCQKELEKSKTMVGACTYHTNECGAGIGIFLRVRDCEIVFLRSPNRGSYICPPYFDEYGEDDQGLHRGNPLKLCKDKYKRLNQLWLGHGLYENIARALETNASVTGQWQHL